MDVEALKYIFVQILLVSFIDFIKYVLWVCGSSFTVGVVEEDAINSIFPEPIPSPAAISLPYLPNLESPIAKEKSSGKDPATKPKPTIEPKPEPAPDMDHKLEPPQAT